MCDCKNSEIGYGAKGSVIWKHCHSCDKTEEVTVNLGLIRSPLVLKMLFELMEDKEKHKCLSESF